MKLSKKIENHFNKKKFSRITRSKSDEYIGISQGYIVDYSKDFIIIQETDDFRLFGNKVIPKTQIEKIRYNDFDKYYDKIMEWEGEKKNIKFKEKITLTNWETIFKSLMDNNKKVIVESELSKSNKFIPGEILKVTKKSVYVKYFDAKGILDKKATKISYNKITLVSFNDRYVDVFSKYLREKKKK